MTDRSTRRGNRPRAVRIRLTVIGINVFIGAHNAAGDWIDPSGGLWNDATNWTAGAMPTPLQPAVFNLGSTYNVTLTGDAQAGMLDVRNDRVTLELRNHSLDLSPAPGNVINVGAANPNASLHLRNGDVRLSHGIFPNPDVRTAAGSELTLDDAHLSLAYTDHHLNGDTRLDNNSSIGGIGTTATVGGNLTLDNKSTFNTGSLTVSPGSHVRVANGSTIGPLNLPLRIGHDTTLEVDDATVDIDRGLVITGAGIVLRNGAAITTRSHDPSSVTDTTIGGSGELAGDFDFTRTVFAPGLDDGDTIGTLTFSETWFLNEDSAFDFELAGTGASNHDRIVIDALDPITLDGKIAVSLVGGFTPTLGDTFDLVTTAPSTLRAVTFDAIELPGLSGNLAFDLAVNADQSALQLTVIPAPATTTAMLAAFALPCIRRRR